MKLYFDAKTQTGGIDGTPEEFAALPEEVLKSLRREVIQLAKDGKTIRKRIKARLKIKP